MGKSRVGDFASRGLNPRGNVFGGSNSGVGLHSGSPLDLSFSNFGRGGHAQGGLTVGRDGVHAFFDRHRFSDDHHDFDDHHGHDFLFGDHGGFFDGHHGGFFGGYYYPYGYASLYDTYYYRYPYHYSNVYDYAPIWTVYLDTPVVGTVHVQQPNQTVYIEDQVNGVDVVYPTTESQQPETQGDFIGPVAPQSGGRQTIQVAPQERVPVNNAWLAGGDGSFRAGDYEAARRSFSYAVLEDPRDGFASLAYGLVHFALGDYFAAGDALRRGLSLAPDVLDRPIDIARQYGKAEDLTAHVHALQLHLSARPDDTAAWFVLGYVEYSSGNAEDAARAFSRAASLNPDDPYAATLRDAANHVSHEPKHTARDNPLTLPDIQEP